MDEDPFESEAGFAGLALRPELLQALTSLGYEEPTPIQREAIPPLLAGNDLLGQAATGTGKTAAFALPVLQRLAAGGRGSRTGGAGPGARPASSPSRSRRRSTGTAATWACGSCRCTAGSRSAGSCRRCSAAWTSSSARRGGCSTTSAAATLQLGDVRTVVLDEADEMLDMGFAEDIEAILAETPEDRQTVLFSATMPPRIDGIARRHLRDPVRIQMGREASARG